MPRNVLQFNPLVCFNPTNSNRWRQNVRNGEPNQCSKGRKEAGRRLAVGDCLLWSFESRKQRKEKELVLIGKGQRSLNSANLLEARVSVSLATQWRRDHISMLS